jgi:hypothetical protein
MVLLGKRKRSFLSENNNKTLNNKKFVRKTAPLFASCRPIVSYSFSAFFSRLVRREKNK